MGQPQSLAITSAFEVLGPVMVGPSSSHTAGALRCARVAANLVSQPLSQVHFTLWNSFAHTYRGHGTDRALLAGALGLDTDDERIRDAFELAQAQNISYEFTQGGDDSALHPNTVDIKLVDQAGTTVEVRGESLGGGRIRISRINGVGVEISGMYSTLFAAHRDEPGALAQIAALLAQDGINIAFCRTYRAEAGAGAYTVMESDGPVDTKILQRVRSLSAVEYATCIEVPGRTPAAPGVTVRDYFDDGEQLLAACQSLHLSLGEVMKLREHAITGEAQAQANMKRVVEVMREETTSPLTNPCRSLGGLIGGEAAKINQTPESFRSALLGPVQTQAVARAMAVLERSASMGVIVAAPTAGSAGVVPGCVLALAEHLSATDEDVQSALYAAAAVGLIISTSACVAGAEGGCQAEVGSAAAMAAAACTQLLGGTPEQALEAASLALSNLLGLVCDPVGGLVEVPCQNRNAIGVATAFSSSQLALSGIRSLVPFDQMCSVMLAVGHALPDTLRETAAGGIAIAPAARAACTRCSGCA